MRHAVLAPSRQSPPHDPHPRQCPCLPHDRHRTQDSQRIRHVKCHVSSENESKWKSTSRFSLSASFSAWLRALAFGKPCRVIATGVHAEKEDTEFQKSGGTGTSNSAKALAAQARKFGLRYDHSSDTSQKRVTVNFCARCGTTVCLDLERFPEVLVLCGGTFHSFRAGGRPFAPDR